MNRLKEIRVEKCVSQSQLSKASGVSLRNIKYLEKETTDLKNCRYETLEKIAKALKVRLTDLL